MACLAAFFSRIDSPVSYPAKFAPQASKCPPTLPNTGPPAPTCLSHSPSSLCSTQAPTQLQHSPSDPSRLFTCLIVRMQCEGISRLPRPRRDIRET